MQAISFTEQTHPLHLAFALKEPLEAVGIYSMIIVSSSNWGIVHAHEPLDYYRAGKKLSMEYDGFSQFNFVDDTPCDSFLYGKRPLQGGWKSHLSDSYFEIMGEYMSYCIIPGNKKNHHQRHIQQYGLVVADEEMTSETARAFLYEKFPDGHFQPPSIKNIDVANELNKYLK